MGESILFTPFRSRNLTLRNRIVLSPMCTYLATEEGRANDWHLVHLGSRAVGGCGAIMTEATAVEPRGRISCGDLGLWDDGQIEPLARIGRFCREHGAAFGVQLAHAGRKAYSHEKGVGPDPPVSSTGIPFSEGWVAPRALSGEGIKTMIVAWRDAARRAAEAGCDFIEIHGAHGYLIHQFLSPISNDRRDEYGGAPEGRFRFLMRVVSAIREVWSAERPLWLRISAHDWIDGGLVVDDFKEQVPEMIDRGIDLIDCSSGGIVAVPPPSDAVGPGFQVQFAERLRREGSIATMAVGLITQADQAERILREGRADLIAIGRELLADPHWPLRAASDLGTEIDWPEPYLRARR